MGLRTMQMAGPWLTHTELRALEAGELHIDYDLYLGSPTCAGGLGRLRSWTSRRLSRRPARILVVHAA
jgi:hypothetical protein